MKIISNFKDYYDSGVSYGTDEDTVYTRMEEEVKKALPKIFEKKTNSFYRWKQDPISFAYWLNDRTSSWKFNVIGFCGKMYPVITYVVDYKTSYSYYDVASLKKDKESKKIDWKSFVVREISWDEFSKSAEDFLKADFSDLSPIFVNENVPAFLFECKSERDEKTTTLKYEKYILNPNLKKYKFYKVWDATTAFQEIYMYVGGVLRRNENPMIKISDKDKIKQHGFDPKWGFRKLPSKN